MIREVLEALKMDILDTINNFWETNDGGEYKSGLCGEFAVALGETFKPCKYYELFATEMGGIHYFIEYKGSFYDVNGVFRDADELVSMNEYYMADYPGLDYKQIKKNEINYDKGYIKYLKDVFKKNAKDFT